jgi:MarR family transcriptional regulator, organic hydroperoxide resistance regulator
VAREPEVPVGRLLWLLSSRWRAAVDRELVSLGIPHAQYVFLSSLRGLSHDGHRPSQRELAEWAALDPVYVSKLAKALAVRGLIERATDPRDPRAVQLALTPSGRRTVDRAIELVAALQARLLAPVGGPADPRTAELVTTLRALLDGDAPVPDPDRHPDRHPVRPPDAVGRTVLAGLSDDDLAATSRVLLQWAERARALLAAA